MKTKIIFVSSVLIALIFGFFAGAYQERRAYDLLFMNSAFSQSALEVEKTIRVLTILREGQKSAALSTLETFLDSSLTTFVLCEKKSASERDDFVLKALRDARRYREKYPWSSNYTNVDENINRILSSAK